MTHNWAYQQEGRNYGPKIKARIPVGTIWDRYQRVGRRFKSKILDEFCEVCGYSRKYAIGLLKREPRQRRKRPGPHRRYDAEVTGLNFLGHLEC